MPARRRSIPLPVVVLLLPIAFLLGLWTQRSLQGGGEVPTALFAINTQPQPPPHLTDAGAAAEEGSRHGGPTPFARLTRLADASSAATEASRSPPFPSPPPPAYPSKSSRHHLWRH
jgi:hypothetical protein